MNILVKNNCKKKYRPNPETTITRIVSKVPTAFLEGLSTIEVYDYGEKEYPTARYIKAYDSNKQCKINFYMDSKSLSGVPFFSILEQNIHIINAINNHVESYIKAKTNDQKIINYSTNKINLAWMYIGAWQPFLMIFRLTSFLISRINFIYKLFSTTVNFLLKKTNKKV